MRTAYQLIVSIGISYFLLTLYVHIRPQWLCSVLSLLVFVALVLALLVTAIRGFTMWRQSSRLWMMPAAACLAFILAGRLTAPAGQLVTNWEFKREVSQYLRVVDELRSGAIVCETPCSAKLAALKSADRPLRVRALKAARCNDGTVVVAFLADSDVPLLHEGYVFKGYEETNSCVTDSMRPEKIWPYVRHVAGSWYHFSDQPGL